MYRESVPARGRLLSLRMSDPYDSSMAKEPTADEAIARARAMQDDRLNAIRAVATARQNVADVRAATAAELAELQAKIAQRVADAEREDVRAYNAALSAGWTGDELRKIGFAEPDKKARVAKRAARRGRQAARPQDVTQPAADSGDGEHVDLDSHPQPAGV